MNNINELLQIILELNGSASFKEICDVYQKQKHLVLSQNHKITIAKTLSNNPDIVYLDNEDNKWKKTEENHTKVNEKMPEGVMSHSKPTPGKGMTLKEVDAILKRSPELTPEKYEGSYEWMHKAVKEYCKEENQRKITVDDMNFLYSLAVGTWKMSISVKKDRLVHSNLSKDSKQYLSETIDTIWDRALSQKYYFHHTRYSGGDGSPQVGMFGTGFMTFSGKLSDKDAKSFIRMCTDIVDLEDEREIYNICGMTLNTEYEAKGLKAASASAILHCLKPYVFPIINNNDGHGLYMNYLGSI